MNGLAELWLAIREDARFAVKSLARVKTYTATVILTLALAIGGVTAVFSVLYAVVLRPLPFPKPDELVNVYGAFKSVGLPKVPSSPNELLDIRDKSHSFSKVAGYASGNLNLTGRGDAVRIAAGYVTAEFFRVLGVPPALGRDFAPDEDVLGAADVVLISSAFHRRAFGGASDVVGKTIELDGLPHTIIGVASPVFEREHRIGDLKGDEGEARDVWVPLRFTTEQLDPRARGGRYIAAIGRLKPGASLASARSDMQHLGESFYDAYPTSYERAAAWEMTAESLKGASTARTAVTLNLLLGAVTLVLLAACANVVSLALARLASRKREIAVRVALGATAPRIAVQFLVESVLLGLAGGILGVVIGRAAMDGLLAAASDTSIVARVDVTLQWPVLTFAAIVSAATGLLAGSAPAWHAARLSPTVGLREGGRATSASAIRLRSALVVAQVAVALVLLVGTGMLLRSLVTLTTTSPGFEPKDVYVGTVALAEPHYLDKGEQRRFASAALQNVQAIPGVESAGLTNLLPLSGWSDWGFQIEGDPKPAVKPFAQMRSVAGDYFATLGVRIVAGRAMGPSDTRDAPDVGVVNETLVAKYFRGRNPIGTRILFHMTPADEKWRPFTIVGVVADARDMGIDEPVQAFFYASFDQVPRGSFGLVARAPRLGGAVLRAMHAAVAAADPTQPLYELKPLQTLVDTSLGSRRFTLLLLGVFAVLGLALAVLGIYGITSYSVVQRTQEIAVRMAMGADDVAIVRLVLAQALRLVGIGLFFGALFAAALGRFLTSAIYGLVPWDPQAVAIIAVLFVTAALVAGWVPARRAAALPLANALRAE
ncbi:MAG TPA: ABC transporter permease [Polyangiaceae bacterium]|nr:ABC transporter permease [Polyangiaceae bacterium]